MTQEDKILLFKDLGARLLYGVKCRVRYIVNNETTYGEDVWFEEDDKITRVNFDHTEVYTEWTQEYHDIGNIKLYLRPMASMTEEELDELRRRINKNCNTGRVITKDNFEKVNDWVWFCNMREWECVGSIMMGEVIDYLNEHMFDWRGLIPKGLAIAVTEENNPYKV